MLVKCVTVTLYHAPSRYTAQLRWRVGSSRSQLSGQRGDGVCSSGEWE